MKRLYITEKPTQVIALRSIIRDKDVEFQPLAGHLFSYLTPEEHHNDYEHWYNAVIENKLPFIPLNFDKKISETVSFRNKDGNISETNYKQMFENVKRAINNCDEIVIASDPDNEGASLAYEVIQACNATHKVKGMMNMAATDPSSLLKSLKEFEENPNKIPYKEMALASDARAMFDWSFGMNLTMGATVALGNGEVLHLGSVKLPTLRMVVERDLAFENFVETPFWKLKGIAKDPKSGIEFSISIKYNGLDKIEKEDIANEAFKNVNKEIIISKYSEENKYSKPGNPYSLLDMASEVFNSNGLSMTRSENAAQSLYDKGFLSYPRTEERFYSDGEYKQSGQVIKGLNENDYFKNLTNLKTPYKKRDVFDDKKIEGKAHGALSPTTKSCDIESLSHDEKIVYLAVAKRYYSQFMEDYQYKHISIKSSEDKYEISSTENIAISNGWKEIFESLQDSKERTLPTLNNGDKLEIISIELEKGFTKPKPRFTELSLAQAMENIASIYDDPKIQEYLGLNGIGAPSTRKKIIQELKADVRDFRKVEPYLFEPTYGEDKYKIVSSKKTREMISLLPDIVTSPILRADLESKTKDIVLGKLKIEDFKKELKIDIKNMYDSIINIGLEKGIRKYNMWNDDGRPSKKQVDFIKKMAEYNQLIIPEGVLENKEMLGHWLEKKQKSFRYALSDKQKELLFESTNYKVKNLLKNKDFNQDEFTYLSEQVKYKLIENKKSWVYNLSDKQRELLENKDNNVDEKVLSIIKDKTEFNTKEWAIIQRTIKDIFSKPKEFKNKDFNR